MFDTQRTPSNIPEHSLEREHPAVLVKRFSDHLKAKSQMPMIKRVSICISLGYNSVFFDMSSKKTVVQLEGWSRSDKF